MKTYLALAALAVSACATTTPAQQAWVTKTNQITNADAAHQACQANKKRNLSANYATISAVLWGGDTDPPLSYLTNEGHLTEPQRQAYEAVHDATQQCLNQYSASLARSSVELSNLVTALSGVRTDIAMALLRDEITIGEANGYFRKLSNEANSLWMAIAANMQNAHSAQHQAELARRQQAWQQFGEAVRQQYGPRPSIDVYVHD